ncbi:MarR family winged helix-turn-helix transcriptional regulator [Nocardia huaxiensis]|uniref:MarR family transcriptional regulator n=1 Tax=Nocardia huaxiensis TaxID=2755382 RepID=A0A7D6VDE0_9NOCA|nr:helix-turn-helix domain-containing protein [Nocardia huaxiensis]QLY29755.1 MarR family transcriptional regulator [Nocardia huaxiensis]UFS96659.1 MarR family winged helix-turn-helix transcriptional regulator [Nocardia huaxiensis]
MQHLPGRGSPEISAVHDELTLIVREIIAGRPGVEGLPSFTQQSTLSFIDRNPGCRATQIAEAFGVHRSTVSRQLRGCVDAGWVETGAGSLHAGYPLALTAAGRDALAAAAGRDLTQLGERMADWTPREIADFARALRRFRQPDPTTGDDRA